MLSRMTGLMWMEDRGNEENRDELGSFSAFKSMLDVEEDEWNMAGNSGGMQGHPQHFDARDLAFSPNLLLNPVDSPSSCSPSTSVLNCLDPSQLHFSMPPNPRPPSSSLLNVASATPLVEDAFDLGCASEFLDAHSTDLMNRGSGILTNFADLSSNSHICTDDFSSGQIFSTAAHLLPSAHKSALDMVGFRGFEEASSVGVGGCLLLNRSKLLRPLETFPPVGEQPTLFQKRAAFRKHLADKDGANFGVLGSELNKGKEQEKVTMRRNNSNGDSVDEPSIGGSGLNYDSDDLIESYRMEEGGKKGGNSSNANCTVTEGDEKGKKKGLPAKNLMAERRRRKKLNDRLYMLRSVVPKISKMDRASILGDAIEYLKELLRKINDLHNELESAPTGPAVTPTASFHPLTPTLPSLPCRIKEELCSSSMPSPNGQQPARVEVRAREGRAVYIHMFCGRKPGLLLSTMRALDELGLDIQQAVISCFNGFALDIFQAEQCKEGQDLHPDQIKAVLLDSAGFHGML